jgi:hypothetical protein
MAINNNNTPIELKNKIKRFYKRFLDIHNTEETQKMARRNLLFETLPLILNYFNCYIGWARAKEGYTYYYTLNLRWVIGITYIAHEFDHSYDDLCLRKLRNFWEYSNHLERDESKRYKRQREIYDKKIKKIEEIFGISK